MGIDLFIAAVSGFGGFLVFMFFGVLATRRHHKNLQSNNISSWAYFIIVAFLVCFAAALLGYFLYPTISNDQSLLKLLAEIIYSSILMGGSPGLGLIFAALGAKWAQSDDKNKM